MGTLTITASYDPSISNLNLQGNGAYNPTLYSQITGAINLAIQYFQTNFATIGANVNSNIIFGWGSVTVPGAGVTVANATTPDTGGVSPTAASVTNFAGIKALTTLAAAAPGATAAQKTSWNLINSLTTDPTNGGSFTINPGQIKLLDPNYATDGVGTSYGITSTSIDGGSVINSTWNWNWTQTNFTAGQYDAVSVEEHEISEVLGRSMTGGASNGYTMMDFYDYSAAGNPAVGSQAANAVTVGSAAGSRYLNVTAAATPPQTYFSADGTTVGLAFTVPAGSSDIADWSSPGSDAFGGGGPGVIAPVSATDQQVMNVLGLVSACFATGTRIATPEGEIPVEHLQIGQRVVLASGGTQQIVWIGHRTIDVSRHPYAWDILPVHVLAGAFAEGVPSRDLLLSPDHAVFANGVLIPVRYLINDCTISQEHADLITYWHVELDTHDVILAEGLPCESYLDTGNRDAFDNAEIVALHARFCLRDRDVWAALACAPLVESGTALETLRAGLARRAGPLLPKAETITLRQTGQVRATLPAGTSRVHLLSPCARPDGESRRPGAAIASVTLDGTPVPETAAATGFHAPEQHWRWTHGEGVLLVQPANAPRELVVNVAMLA